MDSPLNCFDFLTNIVFFVEITLIAVGIQPGGIVKALKAFRMVRIFKLASTIPTFRSLVGKMGSSLVATCSMLIVLFTLLFFISCSMLHLFHNLYDEYYGACLTADTGPAAELAGISLFGNASALHTPANRAACALKPVSIRP